MLGVWPGVSRTTGTIGLESEYRVAEWESDKKCPQALRGLTYGVTRVRVAINIEERAVQMQRIWVLLAALLLGGCAMGMFGRAKSPAPCSNDIVAVLDFSMAPRVVEERDPCTRKKLQCTKPVESEKDIRGWWFGSQDVYYNDNMGRIAADLFSDALRNCGTFQVYSRNDLRRYYADKSEAINEQFKMDRKQLDEALVALNPVSIGREIGVQKVVVGQICDTEMRHSRTFGPFSSAVSFTVSLYDVATGQLEFSQTYSDRDAFSTPYAMFEDFAGEFVADMRRCRER